MLLPPPLICGRVDRHHTPIASATRPQLWSSTPSSRRRYVVATASKEWSRNAETVSTDSPASRLSFAALCLRVWTPLPDSPAAYLAGMTHGHLSDHHG